MNILLFINYLFVFYIFNLFVLITNKLLEIIFFDFMNNKKFLLKKIIKFSISDIYHSLIYIITQGVIESIHVKSSLLLRKILQDFFDVNKTTNLIKFLNSQFD